MSTAIEFNHVGKQYRLGLVSTGTIAHDLNRWWQTSILRREDPYLKIGSVNDRAQKADSEYVWALRDIDFKVEQGDVVGIIGKNGAGKSTLLKLLSKVTAPTTGTIRARGRIASLLEVGTGFHGEMTGRENIYMNGAILGMTKQEIAAKLDEIVAFSGCERYIDTPVKRYSSGMMVRLGFAVAAHLDPEILVVDEVLAVGDAEFQKKAIGKMKDVSQGEGRTVLFVSHNMASIRALCNHGVLLENGMVKMIGNVNPVVDAYLKDNNGSATSSDVKWTIDNAPHKGALTVLRCAVRCENDIITNETPFDIEFEFMNDEDGLSLGVNPHVFNAQDICLFNVGIGEKPLPKGRYRATFHVPGGLFCEGSYRVDNLYFSHNNSFFNHEHALTFAVYSVREDDFSNYRGVIYPASVTGQLQTL